MRTKIILILALLILPFFSNKIFSQTVSGTASNTGCQNSGIVTASSTGLGATPQYQLLKSGVAVAPVPGDLTQFTNTPLFSGLTSGTYVVNARAATGGTVYSSAPIAVTDGYTSMTVTTPTKIAGCIGGTAVLTSTVAAGKAPFTYTIAAQDLPGTILQSSGSINANTFTFNGLPANSYVVSVTDDCGQTVIGATAVTNPTLTLNDIKLGYIAYPGYLPAYNCAAPLNIINSANFRYVATSTVLSAADAANFTWKIKYQGQLYGKDTDGDGFSDVGGAGYPSSQSSIGMPAIATRAGIEADLPNMRAVLIDNCGNTKEFPISFNYNTITSTNCGGNGIIRIGPSTLACLPIDMTFTNTTNPADVITGRLTTNSGTFTGFTAGATYHITYIDAGGNTTGDFSLPASQNLTIPAVPNITLTQYASSANANYLGYGTLSINVSPFQVGDAISYTVTASNNSLVPIGYSGNITLDGAGYANFPKVNASDPTASWPKGNYTLNITTPCGTKSINVTVAGYAATVSDSNTITSVCGGFNYVMNGNFDTPSAYQVIIVSGPSSVGQTRNLASTTASLPFNGLSYGTYVFSLRTKSGTLNLLTQTVTYDANNAIVVDKTNTGGYVCAAGATNGVLTIEAISNSPAPNNIMEYAISVDGGTNYSAYQSANTFGGLTDATYFYRIKDGCGNIITQSAQIGVAAAPTATADGIATPATFCNSSTGTIQLDVDISGGLSYLWTGPGINATNQTLKDPLINYSDLAVGTNNFTCTVTLGAPCNSSTVSNLAVIINAQPTVIITNPAAVCFPNTIDITTSAVTAGSDTGLTYSYFSDEDATIPLSAPNAITVSETYYIKGTNGNGCSTISPIAVTINTLPTAEIAYLITPYCNTGTATVEQIGIVGGTYSSDSGLSINAATGEIDLAASTLGDHTITYTFNDGNCSNTTSADITINALPTATISYPNASYCNRGTASPIESGVPNGLYSSDAGLSIDELTGIIDLAASTPGSHTITYAFSNGTCPNLTTTVVTINPTTLPAPLAAVTGQCEATAVAPTLTDPCAGTITATTPTVFPITAQGTTVVTWTFDYGNGYTQTVNQNVTVADTFSPVMPILADVTGQCEATPAVPISNDACTGAITGTTTVSFPITAKGTTVVLWTFDDGNGNISFENQNVIITDTTAPAAPVLTDVTGECSVLPTAPTAVDNCDSGLITGTTSTLFPITTQGTTVITWSFTDSSGNVSTANQNVIIDDVTAPAVPVLADVTAECSATPTVPTTTDNCAGTIAGTTATVFPITTQGTTVVTWSFDDGNGNVSTADQNVIIDDVTAPAVPVLADVTAACSATPEVPTTTDNCAGTITGTTATVFPITAQGTTVVTWSFDDGNGNVSTAAQNVIISPDALVPPVLADITGQCSVTPSAPVILDSCGAAVTGTTTALFPITAPGTTVITWTFANGSGSSVTAAQNVIITNAALSGTPLAACLGSGNQYNVTLSVTGQGPFTATGTGAPGTWSGNVWTSNAVAVGTDYSISIQDANACNTITASGASPASCCIFNVVCPTFQPAMVSCYDELPAAATLTKAQFEALGNGNGRITSCGALEITAANSADQGCSANITRTYTVTEYNDANGNGVRDAGENTVVNSSSCTQTIAVHDTTAPVFAGVMPQAVVNADCGTIPPAAILTATDNCGTAAVAYEETRADGGCSSRYSIIRTWTASDQCGNQNSFVQTINVSCVEEVYNAISANGDGLNDSFFIKGIDCYPDNVVKIYNRYGVIVYEKNGYDNVTNPFQGFSDGRATIARGNKLPTGTYFYTLEYDSNGTKVEKGGYLYVNAQ
ncbi:hypothetical protein BSF41_44040 [Flavobacterium sp. ACN2]|uniref:gliding motility-associated C-terminal domain-containing protein n=1 Tax=Flavobacterium sp. ACN2 TaxID=1975676 RepID=UPI000BB3B219|nr:gliding motility-associated C-terminal domain-containing protein [Flavobacterium sp. ACN2]PBI83971.1 hypothetical protein BSF41_44040 [Flavobacterium sp. ACN2]